MKYAGFLQRPEVPNSFNKRFGGKAIMPGSEKYFGILHEGKPDLFTAAFEKSRLSDDDITKLNLS